MATPPDRTARRPRIEVLEGRRLLTLIGAQPTIDAINGQRVRHTARGGISIVQPAPIHVSGTAQPGAPGATVSVGIYAEDSQGNIVNNGLPLATVTPDMLGQYKGTIYLPSTLRKDVNYLVARETATAVETSTLAINGTTISGLSGNLNINSGILTGLTGTVANAPSTITGLGGTVAIPATPITGIAGTLFIEMFPLEQSGGGQAGPAGGTLFNGAAILNAQVGTLSGGTGTVGASTSTLNQTGTSIIAATTGTFSNGTGTIAPTSGTETQVVTEVSVSAPLAVLIHQPKVRGARLSPANLHYNALRAKK